MKRFISGFVLIIIGVIVGMAIAVSVYYFTGASLFERLTGHSADAEIPRVSVEATNAELTNYAFKIANYMKDENYDALAEVIHPEYGVIFSPYATISLSSNKYFTPDQVEAFANDKNKYVWGKYDGNGNPIDMTPSDYFKSFVFDKDYTLASEVGVDKIVNSGNALENIRDVFPDIRFVDFYIPGSTENNGYDWSILRLGFEQYKGQLKLTLILHSEWTI